MLGCSTDEHPERRQSKMIGQSPTILGQQEYSQDSLSWSWQREV
jgi:hypothetical protein